MVGVTIQSIYFFAVASVSVNSLAFQDGFYQIICPEDYYHFTFNIIQQITFAMSNLLSFQI